MTVGIVGLGLIGGSMAKTIRARTEYTVLGTDLDEDTMALAKLTGTIHAPLTSDNLSQCSLILLAIRPGAAVDWVTRQADSISKNAIVVDLCGVKRSVVEQLSPLAQAHGFAYVGGHPMAGREKGGFRSSTPDLYLGASMILTPDRRVSLPMLEQLKAFFLEIGFGKLTFSTPEEHDRVIAFTSQLSHIIANAYIKSPEAQRRSGFSGGSFRDMTRVAKLDEEMWTELFLEDADFLSRELDLLIHHLSEYKQALDARDAVQLCALLRDGREKQAAAGLS